MSTQRSRSLSLVALALLPALACRSAAPGEGGSATEGPHRTDVNGSRDDATPLAPPVAVEALKLLAPSAVNLKRRMVSVRSAVAVAAADHAAPLRRVIGRADAAVEAAVAAATPQLVAALRSARLDGKVNAREDDELRAATEAADAEVSSALNAVRPAVAYAVWSAMRSARAPNPVDGKPQTPEKINEAMRGVRSELVKSRETMTRHVSGVATAVAARRVG